MTLTKSDLEKIGGLLNKQKEEIISVVDGKLEKQRKEINADMADLIHEQNDYLDTQFKEIGHRFDTMERRFEKHEDRLINSFNSNL